MIKIEHDELNNYKTTMDNYKEKLAEKIEDIRKDNERLSLIWKGSDAVAYCDNLRNFANKMDNIVASMDNLSGFIKLTDEKFKEVDEKKDKKLRAARARYKTS